MTVGGGSGPRASKVDVVAKDNLMPGQAELSTDLMKTGCTAFSLPLGEAVVQALDATHRVESTKL